MNFTNNAENYDDLVSLSNYNKFCSIKALQVSLT